MAFVLLKHREQFRYMSQQINNMDVLGAAIQLKHQCQPTHWKSVFVREKLDDETVWEGFVEVFDLAGHPKAKTYYAWQNIMPDGVKIFTVLENQFIDSPCRAIQAAIFMDVQSPSLRCVTKAMTPDGANFTVAGTSCAAPLWAGFAALANEQAVASA